MIIDPRQLWRNAIGQLMQPPAASVPSRPPSPTETLPPDYTSSAFFRLPGYSYYPRPSRPLIYTFSEWEFDSMNLMSPLDAPSYFPVYGPMYTISARMAINPLLPVSCITTVRRGSGDTGALIGRFDISLNRNRQRISFGPHDISFRNLTDMLYLSRDNDNWIWTTEDVALRWDCRSMLDDGTPVCNCYGIEGESGQLASFVPQPLHLDSELEGSSLPPAILTVWPDGHQYLDDILFSILVLERKRMIIF